MTESKAMVQALRAACRHLLVHLAVDHFEAAIEFGDALVAAQEVLALARRVVKDDLSGETKVEVAPWTIRGRVKG